MSPDLPATSVDGLDAAPSPFPVVGVGASAGGLEAFTDLLHALPASTGLAFVFIQHLDPNHESQLAEILSRATTMPVVQAEHGQRAQSDHVYVIPPNAEMTILNGNLQLTPRAASTRPHHPIDRFFMSLASDQGSNAVGIVLSGSASDGAEGLQEIKSRFGTTFAQDEQTSKYGEMPRSAEATGAVDFVLPPAEIARELSNLKLQRGAGGAVAGGSSPESEEDYRTIFQLLKSSQRVDFSQYKRNTLSRRIGRRMMIRHLPSMREYVDQLRKDPREVLDLYRDILISVTSFFREPAMYAALSAVAAESIKSHPAGEAYRIWVAGCATGEEAYSLAILVCELAESAGQDIPIQVFGTDISDAAIERARSGIYPHSIEQDVSPERLRRFYARVDAGYRINHSIREHCIFARHDLTADAPFSHMDLVSCRNVLIYLGTPLHQRILSALHYSLKPEGLLVLGSAESIGTRTDLFGSVDNEKKIFIRKPAPLRHGMDFLVPQGKESAYPDPGFSPASPLDSVSDVEARAARVMRELYGPAGVIVNDAMQVVHFYGQTGFYLEQPQGEASLNLLKLARESLVYVLRKAVEMAIDTHEAVHETDVLVEKDGRSKEITLHVLPLGGRPSCFLVLFEEPPWPGKKTETASALPETQPSGAGEQNADALGLQLSRAQREISLTRDYLRKTIEQHEATTEELRAANEEARSANEELQSTNEELRTAKEELQSSNEELITVNEELTHRNEELDAASNDLNNVLNAATIPVVMVGMDLRLKRFTPAAERLLNLTPADLGRAITDIHPAFRLPELKDMLLATIDTLAIQQRNAQDRDGRWYSLVVRPYRTMDDRIDGAVITFLDIDDITVARERAENARDFAEGIVETVQHPLLVLDSTLRIVRATAAFFKTFQVSESETQGRRIDEVGNGQWNIPELRTLLEQTLVRDVPILDLDVDHIFPHIGHKTMRLNARRIDGRGKNPHTLLLAIEDVTERREVAEIQYRRLFESAKDAIIVIDAQSGRVVDVNPFFTELSRYPKSEVVGKPFWELEAFLDDEQGRRLVPEAREREMTRYESVTLRARDGRHLTVEIIANRYEVKGYTLIQANIRDVTEKRKTEERLRRSNLDLEQFAFAASHDLQEPLRTITSYLELFKVQYEGKLDAEADQYMGFITTAGNQMRQMVLDLLGYSHITRSETRIVPVNVEAVLASALLNLQMAISSGNAAITFDPLPTIDMDPSQLLPLLQNLLVNAIKYRGAEPPRIHLSASRRGAEWVFSVKDNGIGIDPRYWEQIFTVFRRLHGREYPGTGVGLAICKRIVDRHEGAIWVDSEPGKGSTFYFSIPDRI